MSGSGHQDGRGPVHLRPDGAVTNRDRVWAAMRQLKEFTALNLRKASQVDAYLVRDYIKCYLASGHIEARGQQYLLVNDAGIEAPKIRRDGSLISQGQGQEIMWRTMRLLKDFSVADLVAQGKSAGVEIKEDTAGAY
jgi:hypothetical protein